MSLDRLVEIIHAETLEGWTERNREAFDGLFGGPAGRYPKNAEKVTTLRAPAMSTEGGVPFAAYIHADNPRSGPYSGLSFVIFPVEDAPSLVGLVVGTQGLAPDEAILGRPGHARKTKAVCSWLNQSIGAGKQIAWAKQDPTRTDITVPDEFQKKWPRYGPIFQRYGREIYALFVPTEDRAATKQAVTALLDLMFEERGFATMAGASDGATKIQGQWFDYLMPQVDEPKIIDLLNGQGFVIIQGPPGTGKTRAALSILRDEYQGFGKTVQFHPNTTYENFVGGLAPVQSSDSLGLQFRPAPGFLLEATVSACSEPNRKFLLHIDEINRADLSKVLGEAIFLLEWNSESPREVSLPYDFGPPFHQKITLPKNLHILGTMNTADRSIAIVDVAVRRRFAFSSLWPKMRVVEENGCSLMQEAFRGILQIFIEHAGDDAFNLVPGHAYFLEKDESQARRSLQVNLAPLLEEYLAQGYVGGFAEPIRSYLQWLQSL